MSWISSRSRLFTIYPFFFSLSLLVLTSVSVFAALGVQKVLYLSSNHLAA